jgi:hypothetical protein
VSSALRRGSKPLAVVALDGGGYIIATEREDGASNGRVDIASGKATSALEFGMGSRSLMTRAEQQATSLSQPLPRYARVSSAFREVCSFAMAREGCSARSASQETPRTTMKPRQFRG